MIKLKAVSTAFLITAATVFGNGDKAQASDYGCYGAFSVSNPTKTHIYYQVRWGDGSWDETCLAPGKTMVHYEVLDEDGCVSKPQVRFDWIAGDDCVTNKIINPKVYRAHCLDDAKPHHFKFSACGTKITLYATAE